jgi:hypothetical protein
MKFQILVFILLFFFLNGSGTFRPMSDCYVGSTYPKSASDCIDATLDTDPADKKQYDLSRCCFLEKKNSEDHECIALTSHQLKKIGSIVKDYEKNNYYRYEYSLDCGSSYLKACLFLLISLIFF